MSDNTARVSPTDLLHAVEQLPPAELDEFVKNVVSFQAYRTSKDLSATEADLILYIQVSVPTAVLARYRELIALRRAEQLTSTEHTELLQLGETIEAFHLQRMTKLVELATLRNTPLEQVMDELTIHPEPYECSHP